MAVCLCVCRKKERNNNTYTRTIIIKPNYINLVKEKNIKVFVTINKIDKEDRDRSLMSGWREVAKSRLHSHNKRRRQSKEKTSRGQKGVEGAS